METKGIKRKFINDLRKNRDKYHNTIAEATQNLNDTEYGILRQQILSPIDLLKTYIGVLPGDILRNHLYKYINFSLTYFESSIVCPHGNYVKPLRVYSATSTRRSYEEYRLVYCHGCGKGYVFMANSSEYFNYVHDCLFVVKYICRKPFEMNINNNSYQMEFQYNRHYTITAVLDSNIIEFDIHT